MQRLRIAPFYIFLGAGALQSPDDWAGSNEYSTSWDMDKWQSLSTLAIQLTARGAALSATGHFGMLGGSVAIAVCTICSTIRSN